MGDKVTNKDEAIKQYQMQFWKSLSEILEAAKPLIISAIKEHNERKRF